MPTITNTHVFEQLVRVFPFTRTLTSVHVHHSYTPDQQSFHGKESMAQLRDAQMRSLGTDTFAQHITIDPQGFIWTGRNWNAPPHSANGHNGNTSAGPFMITLIGNFSRGNDMLEGAQKTSCLHAIKAILNRANLPAAHVRFHSQLDNSDCPGDNINYESFITDLQTLESLPELQAGVEEIQLEAFSLVQQLQASMPVVSQGSEGGRMSKAHHEEFVRSGGELSAEQLSALRPHVINLRQGVFSNEGLFQTTQEDVDALFQEHLFNALTKAEEDGRPLRIVFYAHGGLVSEKNGLLRAYHDLAWWKSNHVYPIYFVWETGLWTILSQLLRSAEQRALVPRDAWDLLDPILEATARALGGQHIWSAMKQNAAAASQASPFENQVGGAYYTITQLKAFLKTHKKANLEVHALGHSAGSNFHGFFLPELIKQTGVSVSSLHLLAPAMQLSRFKTQLLPLLGDGIKQLSIFTMNKDLERADHCVHVYHKSLLYLIYYALEHKRKEDILGLEISLRKDPHVREALGLAGARNPNAEVIWALTHSHEGQSASQSRSHGGFNTDQATMTSVIRRILKAGDHEPVHAYPAGQRDAELDALPPAFSKTQQSQTVTVSQVNVQTSGRTNGRKRALCIGINAYPTAPLNGCVADAELWAHVLKQRDFETPILLTDAQATRERILNALELLVRESQAGDVLVFQYSGHGTQLPDVSGDEALEDTPEQDEAICPVDFDAGAFVIDDDIAEVFAGLPDGVNLTCFIDCCHSGTISRFAVGAQGATNGLKARFVVATSEMKRAHRQYRLTRGLRKQARAYRGPASMREVVFSACQSNQVAWEQNGQGDFTRHATRVLQNTQTVTHAQFVQQVITEFGPNPRQLPLLDCAPHHQEHVLLAPLDSTNTTSSSNPSQDRHLHSIAEQLRIISQQLDALA